MAMRNVPVLISGVLLGLFGVIGAGLVGLSHEATAERIARNEREALLRQLQALLPADQTDNDILNDFIDISVPDLAGTATTRVYRGRRNGQPVAAVLSPVVTQGYSGPIQLIVAVRRDGTLAGVRVLKHRETPGLGDKIEIERSDWVLGFAGRSLTDPLPGRWKVRRDGGDFDQFTGATVTPRAVVRGVRGTLEYFAQHADRLFGVEQAQAEKHDG
jgi:electron transport complex protein RnfG